MTLDPAIEFREPETPKPGRPGNSVDWDYVVKTLKARKNDWGMVGEFSSSMANHIKTGRYKAFHPYGDDPEKARSYMAKHWEVTVRRTGDAGRFELYIRWLG